MVTSAPPATLVPSWVGGAELAGRAIFEVVGHSRHAVMVAVWYRPIFTIP